MMRAFLLALQFLTRLPLPATPGWAPREVGRSLLFYPLVGALIGGMLMTVAALLATAPAALGAALVLVVWVLLTGALHLDGLADSGDAWVGGHGDRERTLAIMKDPSAGPVGVTLIVLVLLLKFTALQSLLAGPHHLALLLAPLLARAALPLLFLTTPYVRPGGLGEAMANHLPRTGAAVTVVTTVAVALLLGGAAAVLVAAGTFVVLRTLMLGRLAGTTGDTAGATVEIVEATVLVTLALAA